MPLEWFGDGDAGKFLDRVLEKFPAEPNSPEAEALLTAVGQRAEEAMRRNIYESHTPEGVPFPALKSVSEGRRPRSKGHGQDQRPLLDTFALVFSIGSKVLPEAATVAVGFTQFYGVYQDSGTGHIPARHFAGVPDGDLVDATLISEFVNGSLVEARGAA